MRHLVVLLCVCLLPRPGSAQATAEPPPPPVLAAPSARPAAPALSGDRNVFALPDCTTTLTLRLLSPRPLAAIRTGDVIPRPAAPPPAWTVEWSKPAPTGSLPDEWVSTGRIAGGCPRAGLFSLPLAVYDDGGTASALTVTLVREAAPVLGAPAAATLAVERLFGLPGPAAITVRQTEPGAGELRLLATGGELRTEAGDGTGIVLEPANSPVSVRAGQSAQLLLVPSAPPPPGVYATRLTLASPALPQAATVEVTYRVRLALGVLAVTLAAGVALGWWVNGRIAARAAFDAAVASGLRALQATTRRVTPQRDPAVQQRLLAVANLLQTQLEAAANPEEVHAHVLDAEAQAKDIEGRAVQTATGLQAALQQARHSLRPGGQALDDAVASRLAGTAHELDALQAASDAGDTEQTAVRLQDFNRDLPARLMPELRGLLADIDGELGTLGTLPTAEGLEATRVAIGEQARSVYAESELVALVKGTDAVARRLRSWMDLSLPRALAQGWREAAKLLNASKPVLSQRLIFAAEQADQLRRTARDPLTRLASLSAFRKGVLAALGDAADGDRAVEAAVADGDVRRAAKLLAKSNEPDPAEPPRVHADVATADARPAPPAAAAAALRIQPLIPIGADTLAAIRWIGERPAPGRLAWHCHPPEAASVEPVAAGALVRPRQPGFIALSLTVDGVRLAEARTYAGEVTEPNVYGIARPERRSTRLALTLATALVTFLAGFAVLEPAWLGTVGDIARAFLWGCFGQFGLDRLRELSRPLLSRRLSV